MMTVSEGRLMMTGFKGEINDDCFRWAINSDWI